MCVCVCVHVCVCAHAIVGGGDKQISISTSETHLTVGNGFGNQSINHLQYFLHTYNLVNTEYLSNKCRCLFSGQIFILYFT